MLFNFLSQAQFSLLSLESLLTFHKLITLDDNEKHAFEPQLTFQFFSGAFITSAVIHSIAYLGSEGF